MIQSGRALPEETLKPSAANTNSSSNSTAAPSTSSSSTTPLSNAQKTSATLNGNGIHSSPNQIDDAEENGKKERN